MLERKGNTILWIPPNIIGIAIVVVTSSFDNWKKIKIVVVTNIVWVTLTVAFVIAMVSHVEKSNK